MESQLNLLSKQYSSLPLHVPTPLLHAPTLHLLLAASAMHLNMIYLFFPRTTISIKLLIPFELLIFHCWNKDHINSGISKTCS
jgi:hypothetical protein